MILMALLVPSADTSSHQHSEQSDHNVLLFLANLFKKHTSIILICVLYMSAFSMCFIVGPALYLIPSRPLWPNNGCISFPMFGNRVVYTTSVNSYESHATRQHEVWQYIVGD